jgi:hypothetical protein
VYARAGELTPRQLTCKVWLNDWLDSVCQRHPKPRNPEKPEWYWPAGVYKKDIAQLFLDYMEENPALGKPLEYHAVLKLLKSEFPHCRRSKSTSMFKCDTCLLLQAQIDQLKDGPKKKQLKDEKDAHLKRSKDEREKYYKHKKKASERWITVDGVQRRPYLSLIIDGITATTTATPSFSGRADLNQKYGKDYLHA